MLCLVTTTSARKVSELQVLMAEPSCISFDRDKMVGRAHAIFPRWFRNSIWISQFTLCSLQSHVIRKGRRNSTPSMYPEPLILYWQDQIFQIVLMSLCSYRWLLQRWSHFIPKTFKMDNCVSHCATNCLMFLSDLQLWLILLEFKQHPQHVSGTYQYLKSASLLCGASPLTFVKQPTHICQTWLGC